MIALIAALMAGSAPAWPEDIDPQTVLALEACRPVGEAEALKCLRRTMPGDLSRLILDRPQPEFSHGDDAPMLQALEYAFKLDGDDAPLVNEYRAAGLPVDAVFSPAVYLLESYWLRAHGCTYDRAERVALARTESEETIATIKAQAAFQRAAPDGAFDVFPGLFRQRLPVSCTDWQETRR